MQYKKTIPEMEADIRQLRAAMNLPGVPDDERAIYATTIARIQAEINARQGPVTPPPPPPPNPDPIKHTAPPPPQNPPAKPGALDTPPIGGGAGGGVATPPPNPPNPQSPKSPSQEQSHTPPIGGGAGGGVSPRVIAPGRPDNNLTADQQTQLRQTHLTPALNATPPTVTIHWPAWDWGPRTYTERQCRQAFATALRDLSESKKVAQGRWDDLPQYTGWHRAIAYYRALTAFWRQPPTRQQLELPCRSGIYVQVFNLIAITAKKETTPTP